MRNYFYAVFIMILTTFGGGGMASGNEGDGCYTSGYNKNDGVYSLIERRGVEKRCVYEGSDVENDRLKILHGIVFETSIHESNGELYALISLRNNGLKVLYLWKAFFMPYGGELSGDFFNVMSNNIKMDYLGIKVNFGHFPESLDDFIEVPPGGQVNERIHLNEYYQLLPQKRVYDIGTNFISLSYKPVTGKGFYSSGLIGVRSNRVTASLDGTSLNDKLATSYGVR